MAAMSRAYQNENDLYAIQAATAGWIAVAGFCGYMNVSDIALRLFNGMRRYDACEIVHLWEDADGHVIGWAMAYPAWKSYEVLLHPDLRGSQLESEMVDWAEQETLRQMRKIGWHKQALQVDVFDGDRARIRLLEQRGYDRHEAGDVISTCSLEEAIPQPALPEGFSIRSLQSEQEAEKLVALINDSFGWHWTIEAYQSVMHSSGYHLNREMVVIAPDGRFASSCILLPDAQNRMTMIENIGTSHDFRRMGLAKGLLYAAMQRMKAQGFTLAMIPHGADPAATALYTHAGFCPAYKISHYTLETPNL